MTCARLTHARSQMGREFSSIFGETNRMLMLERQKLREQQVREKEQSDECASYGTGRRGFRGEGCGEGSVCGSAGEAEAEGAAVG